MDGIVFTAAVTVSRTGLQTDALAAELQRLGAHTRTVGRVNDRLLVEFAHETHGQARAALARALEVAAC